MISTLVTFAFVAACALVSLVESTHFLGTTINWHAAADQANGNAGKMDFNFRIAWRGDSSEGKCTEESIRNQETLGSPVPYRCLSNNCGAQTLGSLEYICTSFSGTKWSSGGNSFSYTFPVTDTVKEFVIGNDFTQTYKCCWIETTNAAGDDIRFRTRISFEPRTDNSQINQSPVTDMVPLLPARVGCEFKMIIPNADPDFDDVVCRWAVENDDNELDECGAACINRNFIEDDGKSLFNATLNGEDCEIIWTPRQAGEYAAAVQLEDFYPSDTSRSNPLSSIPLQWLINVVPRTTSCDTRPIFPEQPHLPRVQPRCFAIPNGGNLTLEIFVGHSDFPSHEVTDSVLILPRGMSASSLVDKGNGVKSVTFTWTPDADQANRPHFMCFMFLDDADAPSDLTCFTVVTSVEQPEVLLDTRSPKESPQAAFDAVASISFTEQVKHPTVGPRYITVRRLSDGHVIQQIDTSIQSNVDISDDFKTISFRLHSVAPYLFEKDADYEIIVEEGAFVSRAASCSGGGPVAEGVIAGEWKFTSAGPPNECIAGTHNCHEKANCFDLPDGFRCECMEGYTGDGVNNCDDINECLQVPGPCHTNADCTNTDGSFECDCKSGYTGDGINACNDINECTDGSHNCNVNADCTNTPGSFECTCKDGFTGTGHDDDCNDIDECVEGTDFDCDVSLQNCVNTIGDYNCTCKLGYKVDQAATTDPTRPVCIDCNECLGECPEAIDEECHAKAMCSNVPGSYDCACMSGYEADPSSGKPNNRPVCIDINECVEGTDFDCDENLQNCVNTMGDYNCTCKVGYKVDQAATTDPTRPTCIDCDECLPECPEAIDEECHAKATCSNVPGSYNCTCMSGYEPDPSAGKPANRPACIDIDECARGTDNCHTNAACTNTPGSFECACDPGYTGNGVNCVDIDECDLGTDTCHDKAVCSNTDGSFDCSCMLGYKPDTSVSTPSNRPVCIDCNECLGECPDSIADKGDCHVNADCTNTPGSFDCTCKDGYEPASGSPASRPTCVNVDECAKGTDTCHEKATCTDANPPLKFDCVCMQGYKPGAGSLPNRPVCVNCDECTQGDCPIEPSPFCDSNAMCTDTPGSFTCECNVGFEGDGFTCIDVSNCSDHWPIIRDRWVDEEGDWVNTTMECPALGDSLPDPTFQPSQPPIDQWDDLRDNFVNALKAWLGTASRIPGMPSDVPDVSSLDPDAQWEALKMFQDQLYEIWYREVGEPNGFSRPTPIGECDDKRLEQWNHFIQISEDAQHKYEMKFGTRCDAA